MHHRRVALLWTWLFFAAAAATVWLAVPPATSVAGVLDVRDVVYVSAADATCAGHKPCYTSVRAAVASAPLRSTVRVATGTYTEPDTASFGYLVWVNKDLRLQGGWNRTFTSRDPAAYPTVLDAQGQGRVVLVYNPYQVIDVVIDGFTIQGGNATGTGFECGQSSGGCGGGIMGANASLLIAGNVITGNVAADSRAEYYHGMGGGVYLTGYSAPVTATLRANIIQNNAASQVVQLDYDSQGGGVYVYKLNGLVFVDNQVTGNTAAWGGGLYVTDSDGASFSGNVISGNGTGQAGGLFFDFSDASTLVGNTISDNADVGLVFHLSDQVHFERNTVQGNVSGGAILPGSATVIGNVISGNGTAGVGNYAALLVGGPALIEGNIVSGNNQVGLRVNSPEGVSAVVRANTITDNLASGLDVTGESIITDNLITGNTSGGRGGGMHLESAHGSVLEDNVIQGNEAAWSGGGMYLWNCGGIVVRHNVVTGNRAGAGGGLYSMSSYRVTLSDNLIFDNEAISAGGGVYLDGGQFRAFTRNAIRQNRAPSGGGVYLDQVSDLLGNDISDNEATDGGGVWAFEYTNLEGNRIADNVAADRGGGLYQERGPSRLDSNHFSGNRAMAGGAVYVNATAGESTGTFEGNTALNNVAGGDGGGFFLTYRGTVTMTNNLLAGNSAADQGDQLYIDAGYFPALAASLRHNTFAHHALGGEAIFVGDYTTLTMVNTIVASHTVGIEQGGIDSRVRADHTFFALNLSNVADTLTSTLTVTSTHEVTGDPAFADPRHGDYRLTSASAAIDAGIDAGVTTDIDGGRRPNGAGYDIGADEWWLRLLLPSIARQYVP